MEKKRPQLNLGELYQLKWLLGGLLAVLSAWTVLYMDVDAWQWLALITVTVPVVIRWPTLTLLVPRWAHRLAFPIFAGLFAVDFYLNREPLPAMIRLALMLVFYRVITPRKRRDELQLILLGLFLVVVAGVLSVSLAFAVQIVVFTCCALVFLLVITLIDSAEAGQPSPDAAQVPAWMGVEWGRLMRRLRETNDWRVATLVLGLFGGVVGLSALFFFMLPRFEIGSSFFLDNLISRQSRSGFSESVRFGEVTDIQQDTSVAMRVEVTDSKAIPLDPYWRMLVLDTYEQGTFSVSQDLAMQMLPQRQRAARVAGSSRPRAGDAIWTFYLEAGISRYLPTLGSFNAVQFNDGAQDYMINDALRLLRVERVPAKMFAYRVEGMRNEPELKEPEMVQARDTVGKPRTSKENAANLMKMPAFAELRLSPEDSAKLTELVRAINPPPGDARGFAHLASAWLAKKHAYSLQSDLGAGTGDSLVRWMSGSLAGHCELFAGSFVLLGRTAGYPTRMVTGFHGGSWNAGKYLTIRNSDAHAWCEIFDEATRAWVRVDPTPGGIVPGQNQAAGNNTAALERIQDTSWTAKMDALRMLWYRQIVDFDHSAQEEMARDAKNVIESQGKALKLLLNAKIEALKQWFKQPWDVGRMTLWMVSAVLGAGMVAGWKWQGRALWMRWRSLLTRKGVDPVRREAGRWLRRMMDAAAQGEEVTDVRAELERLRYGPRHNWPNPQKTFRRAKKMLKKRFGNRI